MASTYIEGWSGAEGRRFTLEVTTSNVDSWNTRVSMKVSISGGSSAMNSHLKVYAYDTSTPSSVYTYVDQTANWDSGVWFTRAGNSNTYTDTWGRKSGARTIRVYIQGYAVQYSDKSNYVTISIPIEGSAPTVTSQTVTPTSATTVYVSATANTTCNLWRYSLDNGAWTDYSSTEGTTGSGTITVTENTHTVKLAGRKKLNNVWGIPNNAISVDTRLATISATIDEPTTDSFSFTASTNYDCNLWEYSIDNGSNWTTFSTTDGTSASGTVSNLTVNTNYTILIRAKRTANNLYSRNATYSVKTQGGIMHVNVNGSWKEAIAYVKIGSAWKQVICYTKVGSSWRINT